MLKLLVVAAAGGLGSRVAREALSKGHSVSVLVRDATKLAAALPEHGRLAAVHVGDPATDAGLLAAAAASVDAIVSAGPPNPALASALGVACLASPTCQKVVWTAGASNIVEADGVTLHYKSFGASGEGFYKAHTPCIDALKATGATSLIWCPGLMKGGARKSSPPVEIRTTAAPAGLVAWDFVTYEDAADAIVRALEAGAAYDNTHFTAVTTDAGAKGEL
jgi:uncharacterized protein YbjT (DUF2867 family)